MTSLRERPEDLAALVTMTAEATAIPAAFVEKDFWVVELLRSVAAPVDGAFVVFKGGTSLSKAYGLIERFSEDVDILLVVPEGSPGQRDRLLKGICGRAERELEVPADLQFSKRGVVRNVRFVSPSAYRDGRVSECVLLEMGVRGSPDPHEERLLRSYVADHVLEVLEVGETEYDEFAPVTVKVLKPERTLVEKLSIVHHLETLDAEVIRTSEKGRHLYDIHQLLGGDTVVAALDEGRFVPAAAVDADVQSAANDWAYSMRPEAGFAASAVFDPAGGKAEPLREAYERVRPLVFGAFPSFTQVLQRVHDHASLL